MGENLRTEVFYSDFNLSTMLKHDGFSFITGKLSPDNFYHLCEAYDSFWTMLKERRKEVPKEVFQVFTWYLFGMPTI